MAKLSDMTRNARIDVEGLPVLEELGSAAFGDDPAAAYRAAHEAPGPGIFRMPDGDGVVVTSYDALVKLMVHPALGAQNRGTRQTGAGESGSLARLDDNSPFFMDEPVHGPMAAAVYQPMSPAHQDELVRALTEIAVTVVDELLEKNSGDLVADYAMAIAAGFWTHFLGLPAEQAALIKACSATVAPMLQFTCTQPQIKAANEAADTLSQCLDGHFAKIKDCPGKTLMHSIAPAIEDCKLPNAPVNAAVVAAAMTFDGVDSVAAATANVLFTCLSNPVQFELLRQDPALNVVAWREAMRVEPSVLGLQRSGRQPIVYEDVCIPADVNVLMLWAAGNRDPRHFKSPDDFDIKRPTGKLLSFGGGGRICKGRHLAMLQGQIALRVLVERTRSIELLIDEPKWSPAGMLRAIQSMPVRLA